MFAVLDYAPGQLDAAKPHYLMSDFRAAIAGQRLGEFANPFRAAYIAIAPAARASYSIGQRSSFMTDTPDDKAEIANEITAAARVAREVAERAEGTPEPSEGRKWPLTKIGIGIGSAALAAALIYAARARKVR